MGLNKIVSWSSIVLLTVLILSGIVLMWAYLFPVSNASIIFFKATKLPVGKVGSTFVGISKVEKMSPATIKPLTVKSSFFNYVEQEKSQSLFDKYKIHKVLPEVTQISSKDKFKIWWTSQKDLNKDAWQKVSYAQTQLSSGYTFATVAEELSQDQATKQFGGDAGFINLNYAFPEYKLGVINLEKGQKSVFASREGLHFVELLDTVENSEKQTLYHIREIFIKESGFDDWYKLQLNNTNVSYYLK